ncbi:MAG: toll/interleukin-1 receptor domain-containing protein [Pseudomonadota bacterium]
MVERRYDVFLSYRREDGEGFARRFKQKLQKSHVGLPAQRGKMEVYLDKHYARATEDFFRDEIRPSLLGSRWLVVVATPKSVLREGVSTDWCARELEEYEAAHGLSNIRVVLAKGDDFPELPFNLLGRMPLAQQIDLRGLHGVLPPERARDDWLALIATIHDLPPDAMPALRRVDDKNRRNRLSLIGGGLAGAAVFATALSGYALYRDAEARRLLDLSAATVGNAIEAAETADPIGCATYAALVEAGAGGRIGPSLSCHIAEIDAVYFEAGVEAALAALEAWPAFRARFELPADVGADGEAADAALLYDLNALEYRHHAATGRWLTAGETDAAGLETRLMALDRIRRGYGPRDAIRWQEALVWDVVDYLEGVEDGAAARSLLQKTIDAMATEEAGRLELGVSANDLFMKELGALRRRLAWSLAVADDLDAAAIVAREAVDTFAAFEQTGGVELFQAALASRLRWRIDMARGAGDAADFERAIVLGRTAQSAYEADGNIDEVAFMREWLAETEAMRP